MVSLPKAVGCRVLAAGPDGFMGAIGAGLSDTSATAPADVPDAMGHVFDPYARLEDEPFGIARAHWMFDTAHPFSDGNGRVGRLVMFKELPRIDAMPLIVCDENRAFVCAWAERIRVPAGVFERSLLYERDYYRTLVDEFTFGLARYAYGDQWDRVHAEAMSASDGIVKPFVHENRRRWESGR